MQMGFAAEDCTFCPEKGAGVGDSSDSVGFDGARCKIWNGPCKDQVQDNEYGVEWKKGENCVMWHDHTHKCTYTPTNLYHTIPYQTYKLIHYLPLISVP